MDTQGGGGRRGHIGLGVQDNGLAAIDAETQYIAQLNIIPLFRIRIYAHTSIVRTHSQLHTHTHTHSAHMHTRTHSRTHTHIHVIYLYVVMYLLYQYCSSSHRRGLLSFLALCASLFLQKYKEGMKEGNSKITTSNATTKTIKNATINLKMQLQTKLANWPLSA